MAKVLVYVVKFIKLSISLRCQVLIAQYLDALFHEGRNITESIFSIPIESNDPVKNRWRKELINVISKGRDLKINQLNSLHIYERHFKIEQLWICKKFTLL